MALIDVVIPLYNHAGVVGRAVRSVLSQSLSDISLTVVDDGSTDEGAERIITLGDQRVRVVSVNRLGPGGARNFGASNGAAQWIAFLDADDEWEQRFLERTFEVTRTHREAGVVYTSFHVAGGMSPPGGLCEGVVRDYFRARLDHRIAMTSSSVLIARRNFENVQGFETSVSHAEDTSLWLRLACTSNVYFVSDRLVTIHRSGHIDDPGTVAARVRGLEQVFQRYEELCRGGLIPRELRRSCTLFIQELEAFRALLLVRVGRRREALHALTLRTRPSRYNWRLYVDCARTALSEHMHVRR